MASQELGMSQAEIDAFMAQEGPPMPGLKPGTYIPIPAKKAILKAAGVPDKKIAMAVLKSKAK
jgi:hypothetical protein